MTVSDFHIHGYDVSHHQNFTPDFSQGGRQFAIMKATEGNTLTDPRLPSNRDRAHDQSMLAVGMYHYAKPLGGPATTQARHFLNKLGTYRPNEFAILDFEDHWDEAWAVDFLHFIQVEYPGPVVFYTYSALLRSNPFSAIQSTGASLWIAKYSAGNPPITSWPWTFWQHTDGQNSVPGNDGGMDCSVFHSNNPADLTQWVGTTPTPDPHPPEDDMTNAEHDLLVNCDNRTKNLEGAMGGVIDTLARIEAQLSNGAAGATPDQIADELAQRLES